MALGLALLAGGCTAARSDASRPAFVPPAMAADTSPAVACPWLDSEHYRPAVPLAGVPPAGAAGVPPLPAAATAAFVPGCAILRFTVNADGTVAAAALRAANPLNDGPTALAVLQQMRFQPARDPAVPFMIRLGMQRDSAGRISITPDTRRRVMRFWDIG